MDTPKLKKPSKYEVYYNSLTQQEKDNIKAYKESIQPTTFSKYNSLATLIKTNNSNLNRQSKRKAYRQVKIDAAKQAELILNRYIKVFPETTSQQRVNCYETVVTRYVYRFNKSLQIARKDFKKGNK